MCDAEVHILCVYLPRLRFLERTMKETMCYYLKTKEMLSIIEPQSQYDYKKKKYIPHSDCNIKLCCVYIISYSDPNIKYGGYARRKTNYKN